MNLDVLCNKLDLDKPIIIQKYYCNKCPIKIFSLSFFVLP
jgi:hypothetical protein